VTRLSERLEAEASSFKIIEWSEPGNIADERHSDETKALLREAAVLAKRYEDAPVRSVLYLNQAGGLVCYVSLPENMAGQRVRILLDTEG
jgi:hypothetical protein